MHVTRHPILGDGAAAGLEGVPADEALIRRLQDSFARIDSAAPRFAQLFYGKLFERHPALRSMFTGDMVAQASKLTDALRLVIEHLRAPATVRSRLEQLGRGHVRYGVRPEHYPPVCTLLVETFGECSGDAWSRDLEQDWSNSLRLVAEIMIASAKAPA